LHGTFANSWGDLKTLQPDWIRDRKVTIIIQHGLKQGSGPSRRSSVHHQARNNADREALDMLLERQKIRSSLCGASGLPRDRPRGLRRAFDATGQGSGFRESGAKPRDSRCDYPMTGEQLSNASRQLSATPAAVKARLYKLFDDIPVQQIGGRLVPSRRPIARFGHIGSRTVVAANSA